VSGRQPPRLAIALLERCVPDNEPLAGDLLEASRERSRAWCWRQVLLAILGRAIFRARANPRLTAEATLVSFAMLALLGFHAVVAASLINHLLVLNDMAWIGVTGQYREWQLPATAVSFAGAVLIGRAIGRFHRDHRLTAVLAFGASATAGAFANLYFFVPNVLLQPLVPSVALQTGVAMVGVAGLFIGIGWRSVCERLPS
jgi:hypothetical protein